MKRRSKILYPIEHGVPLSIIKKTYSYMQLHQLGPLTEDIVWTLLQQVINEQRQAQEEFVALVEKIWEEADCDLAGLDTMFMRQNVLRSVNRGVTGLMDGQEVTEWGSFIKSPRIQKS